MVGRLVRLKLKLLFAGLRRGKAQAIVAFTIGVLGAAAVGLGGGLGLLTLQGTADLADRRLAVVGALSVVWVGWVLGPLVLAASDGTLEPDRLVLFPIPRRTLIIGLLAAASVGIGGLATALVLVGAIGGSLRTAAGPFGAVLAVVGVGLGFALCVSSGRAVSAALAAAANRRRLRDVALLIGPIAGLSINVGLQLVSRAFQADGELPHWVRTLGAIAAWSPPGLAARAIVDAAAGHLGSALLLDVAVAACTLAALAWWSRSVETMLTQAPEDAAGKASRAGDSDALFGRLFGRLPRTTFGACLARELRLAWRDPRQRAQLFVPVVGLGGLVVAFAGNSAGPRSILIACAPSFALATVLTNSLGPDAAGHWVHVGAGVPPRTLLGAKVIARSMIAIPPGILASIALSLRLGRPGLAPVGMALAVTAVGLAVGVGLPCSVLVPVPLPEARGNPFAQGGGGDTLAQIGPSLAMLFGGVAVLVLFATPSVVYIDRPPVLVLIGTLEVAFGALVATVGFRWACRRMGRREPEILLRLTRR